MRNLWQSRGGGVVAFFIMLFLLVGVLGVAPARAGCPTTQGTEGTQVIGLGVDGYEDQSAESRKHVTGRANQSKLIHTDNSNGFTGEWWSVIWDEGEQQYELAYTPDGASGGEDANWIFSEIPVHRCNSGTADDCGGSFAEGEGSNGQQTATVAKNMRYKRRFDMEYTRTGTAANADYGDDELYILSHQHDPNEPGICYDDGANEDKCAILLFRYSRVFRCDGTQPGDVCNPSSHTCGGDCDVPSWDLDSGFPVEIVNDYSVEAADMTLGSYGRVWATATVKSGGNGVVRVYYSDNDCINQGAAADCAPAGTVDLETGLQTGGNWDDTSAIYAHGARLGVLWSQQNNTTRDNGAFFFRENSFGSDAPTTWGSKETVYNPSGDYHSADDHISFIEEKDATNGAGASGQWAAVLKTSNDEGSPSGEPLMVLVARTSSESFCEEGECQYGTNASCTTNDDCAPDAVGPAPDGWKAWTINTDTSNYTRPATAFDNVNSCLHVVFSDRVGTGGSGFDIMENHTNFDWNDLIDQTISWAGATTLIDVTNKVNDPYPLFLASTPRQLFVIASDYEWLDKSPQWETGSMQRWRQNYTTTTTTTTTTLATTTTTL